MKAVRWETLASERMSLRFLGFTLLQMQLDIRSEAKVSHLTAFKAEGIWFTGLESVDRGTCHDREDIGG